MPDPIVIELQRLSSEGNCPIDELLRKSLIVSSKLQIADFTHWIRSELDGYMDKDVPDYRIVQSSLKALNPVTGIHMPIFSDVPGRGDEFSRALIGTPIGELHVLTQSTSKFFQIPLPNAVQRRLHRSCDMPVPMECHLHVSRNAVFGIIDAVRNTIFNWSLQLEQKGILGDGMRFTPEEKALAMTSQNIHINSFQGILGDVSESTVTQTLEMSVTAGDLKSLQQILTEAGISLEDIQQLMVALEADPKPKAASELGPKVSAWIGNMMSKAVSGGWKVTSIPQPNCFPQPLQHTTVSVVSISKLMV